VRLLCLTARLPFPHDRGDRLRAYRVLETLAEDHELTLLSFVESAEQRENARQLESICRDVRVVPRGRAVSLGVTALQGWRRLPLQVLYYRSRPMRRLVARSLAEGRFDAAYVHLFRMAPYIRRGDLPYRIVDLTDVISSEVARSLPYRSLPSRALWALEQRRIARFEGEVASEGDEVWLISRPERDLLMEIAPHANAHVVPNGVDLGTFCPLDVAEDTHRIVFSGHMSVFHNVDAAVHLAEDILPLIRRSVPDCRLRIVGASPGARVRRLASLGGVDVTGFVPDLNRELNRAAVFVAPLRFSAGVQNKVLEAMAAARPVVATTEVAGGIGAVAGRHLLVGRTSKEIAGHVTSLLADVRRRRALGTAAREFVADRFSWRIAAERVRAISDLIAARG
jgi:sugar transferase (PEP-CTERM/EpsH1 system associated)